MNPALSPGRGEWVLHATFATILAGLLWGAYQGTNLLWLVPVSAAALLTGIATRWTEAKVFVVAIVAFAAVLDRTPGLDAREVVSGVFLIGYLLGWPALKALTPSYRLVRTWEDACLLFFVGWSTLSLAWSIPFFDGSSEGLSDWVAVVSLLIFFPARHLSGSRKGGVLLAVTFLVLASFVSVRNLISYREILLSALLDWQQKARVTVNEVVLVYGLIVLYPLIGRVRRWGASLGFLLLFSVITAALIVTQTRAFWVDALLGIVLLIGLLRGRKARRSLVLVSLSVMVASSFVLVFFGEQLAIALSSMLERFVSLRSATTKDLSLISRFFEARAVMEHVQANPFLGHGLGARYSFYDIIVDATLTRSYIHNGYVGMLFKAGLIGTVPALAMWGGWIFRGLRGGRQVEPERRWELTVATVCLIAVIPSASTAMHVYSPDLSFVYGMAAGWLSGLLHRPDRGGG